MEHPKLRLKYGLDKETGKSRYIHEVERGILCNCICPICTQDLVAKTKGEKRTPHFAHSNGAEECKGARMSMLHKLAQEVIQEESKVMLPAYKGKHIHHDAKLQAFDEVRLEEICKNETSIRRPDCIGTPFNDKTLWIEIYCTNPIHPEREADIQSREQYCIEIDFSDLLDTDYTKESVRARLLSKTDDRKWICHPEWDKEEREKADAEKIKQEAERKRQEEESLKQFEQNRLLWEEKKLNLQGSLHTQEDTKIQPEKAKRFEEVPEDRFITVAFPSAHARERKDTSENIEQRDWVMYSKYIYPYEDRVEAFYDSLKTDYDKVTLNNSHPFVVEEVYLRSKELLPRTHFIAEVNITYLKLLLTIWVLDRLNRSNNKALGKLFVENQNMRKDIFRVIKSIENIYKREIEDSRVPMDIEDRETILQILRICYNQ